MNVSGDLVIFVQEPRVVLIPVQRVFREEVWGRANTTMERVMSNKETMVNSVLAFSEAWCLTKSNTKVTAGQQNIAFHTLATTLGNISTDKYETL